MSGDASLVNMGGYIHARTVMETALTMVISAAEITDITKVNLMQVVVWRKKVS